MEDVQDEGMRNLFYLLKKNRYIGQGQILKLCNRPPLMSYCKGSKRVESVELS